MDYVRVIEATGHGPNPQETNMTYARITLAALALIFSGMVAAAHITNGSTTHIVCETNDPTTCN